MKKYIIKLLIVISTFVTLSGCQPGEETVSWTSTEAPTYIFSQLSEDNVKFDNHFPVPMKEIHETVYRTAPFHGYIPAAFSSIDYGEFFLDEDNKANEYANLANTCNIKRLHLFLSKEEKFKNYRNDDRYNAETDYGFLDIGEYKNAYWAREQTGEAVHYWYSMKLDKDVYYIAKFSFSSIEAVTKASIDLMRDLIASSIVSPRYPLNIEELGLEKHDSDFSVPVGKCSTVLIDETTAVTYSILIPQVITTATGGFYSLDWDEIKKVFIDSKKAGGIRRIGFDIKVYPCDDTKNSDAVLNLDYGYVDIDDRKNVFWHIDKDSMDWPTEFHLPVAEGLDLHISIGILDREQAWPLIISLLETLEILEVRI